MEGTSTAWQEDGSLLELSEACLQQPTVSHRDGAAAETSASSLLRKEHHDAVATWPERDGNELLLLHTAVTEIRSVSSAAVLALKAVGERLAESEDRVARLELLIDRIHELSAEIVEEALVGLGWDDV